MNMEEIIRSIQNMSLRDLVIFRDEVMKALHISKEELTASSAQGAAAPKSEEAEEQVEVKYNFVAKSLVDPAKKTTAAVWMRKAFGLALSAAMDFIKQLEAGQQVVLAKDKSAAEIKSPDSAALQAAGAEAGLKVEFVKA